MIEEKIVIKGTGNKEPTIKLIKTVFMYIPKIEIGLKQGQATQGWR